MSCTVCSVRGWRLIGVYQASNVLPPVHGLFDSGLPIHPCPSLYQALQHVKVVFSCMAELCGRAEALASAVGPLVTQLGAVASIRSPAAPSNPWAGRASADTPVAAWRDARPVGSPGRSRLDADVLCRGASLEASRQARAEAALRDSWEGPPSAARAHAKGTSRSAGEDGGEPGGAAASLVTVDVQLLPKGAYQQLSSRSQTFGNVLRAMEAGEQLPGAAGGSKRCTGGP
jgi:hypothetical protein